MHPRLQVSRTAIDMIERFEGYRRAAARLDNGRWTIGYGHIKTARPGAEVSQADAEALLIYDLMEITGSLHELIFTPLTQNQFDALAAFVFNIGTDNFRRSGVLRRINEGNLLQAAFAMEQWRKADVAGERIVVDALVRRRAAEKALFLTPQRGFVPAPTPVMRPRIDGDESVGTAFQSAVEVSTSLDGDRAVAARVTPEPAAPEPAAPEPAAPPRAVEERVIEDPPLFMPEPAVTPAPPQEELSASQIAAAAVTARLQSILDDQFDEVVDPPARAPASLELPPEPAEIPYAEPPAMRPLEPFTLTPPPESAAADASPSPFEDRGVSMRPIQDEPELFTQGAGTFETFDSRVVAHHDFEPTPDLAETEVEHIRSVGGTPLLLGLGLLGLMVFAAGIFWGFNAKHGPDSHVWIIGWGLGLVGIGCVATAVYFLLERLGGREEP